MVKMATIKSLRKMAELNLCKDCYQKYLALIEPTIKKLVSKPLSDWRALDDKVTEMVMKKRGLFKGNTKTISFDEKTYRAVKRESIKKKIEYLYHEGVLDEYSFRLLDKARDIRNKIHDDPLDSEFSEEDYALFSKASAITIWVWLKVMFDVSKET